MAELLDRQWELDEELVMGPRTDIKVTVPEFGAPEIRNNDTAMPREDGTRFGRDQRDGRLLTFEMSVDRTGPLGAVDTLSRLERAWLADRTRFTPGAVSVLRYRFADRVRRVYGRPRRFAADAMLYNHGRVDVTADFQCVDHRYYSDTEFAQLVDIIPPSTGGLVGPLIGPWISSAAAAGQGELQIGGTEPAWLAVRIDGPITDPEIEVVGEFTAVLRLTLLADQFVVIDPSPWVRSVRRNDGANAAGAFTADSPRLSAWRVPPGLRQASLRGNDPSGTARATFYWRDCWSSW